MVMEYIQLEECILSRKVFFILNSTIEYFMLNQSNIHSRTGYYTLHAILGMSILWSLDQLIKILGTRLRYIIRYQINGMNLMIWRMEDSTTHLVPLKINGYMYFVGK